MSKQKPPSQEQRLLDWLRSGLTVTRLLALTELGIFELSARIKDLESVGHTVKRRRITVQNRWGEKASVCEYWMEA